MYFGRKTNKKAVIITAAAAVVIVALLVILNTTLSNRTQKAIDMSSQTGTEPETEAKRYLHMTLYQSDAGAVTFNPAALLSTDEQKAVYSVTAQGEVELQIQPVEGKLFESAEVKTSNFMLAAYDVTDKGIRFVMPKQDVFVTVSYRDDEEWLARQTEAPTEPPTELVTEPITEAPAEPLTEPITEPMTERKTEIPETELVTEALVYDSYNISLFGADLERVKEFGNPFRADRFLNSLGQAFTVRVPESYYFGLKKVSFSEQMPEQEDGCIKRYVYLEEDPSWLILATYYPITDTYLFSDTTGRADMKPETEPVVTAQEEVNIGDGGGSFPAPAPVSGYTAPQTVTTTTTMTLQNVSTVFLGFVEDSQDFSNQVTNYVFNRGLTGNLTCDFAAYEIDPEAQTATFSIILSTGGTISGTFDKNRNAYSFNG